MDQANSPNHEPGMTNRQTFNVLVWIMQVWTISLEVFLRRGFGLRYPDVGAVFVLPLICLFGIAWPEDDLRPLFGFMLLFLLMCFRHRMAALLRPKESHPIHSRYTGLSRLHGLKPFRKYGEAAIKTWIEPGCVAVLGLLIYLTVNEPLGVYLLIGAACQWITMQLFEWELRARAMNLRDQVAEQQLTAERFRQQ